MTFYCVIHYWRTLNYSLFKILAELCVLPVSSKKTHIVKNDNRRSLLSAARALRFVLSTTPPPSPVVQSWCFGCFRLVQECASILTRRIHSLPRSIVPPGEGGCAWNLKRKTGRSVHRYERLLWFTLECVRFYWRFLLWWPGWPNRRCLQVAKNPPPSLQTLQTQNKVRIT